MNTSSEDINKILTNGKNGKISNTVATEYINVRDVAKAHVFAFESEETIGKRLILSNGIFSQQTIVNIINKRFPELRGKVPESGDDSLVENHVDHYQVDNSETKKILNWEFQDLETTIYDTVAQLQRKH